MKYSRLLRLSNIVEPVVNGTPWECYEVCGMDIHVKREDLSSPFPGPAFSKIRGVFPYLQALQADGVEAVGILDTSHSKAGWAVAYCCSILGMTAYDFFPIPKANIATHFAIHRPQRMAACMGAIMIPMAAAAGYVLEAVAKKHLSKLDPKAVMLPVGLKLSEAVAAHAVEVINYTPDELLHGTWIVSSSSGTVAAGLWHALQTLNVPVTLYCHLGYSRPEDKFREYIERMSGYDATDIQIVDEHYEYADGVDKFVPFPCNPFYDAKAWHWLMQSDFSMLEQPIIFWNVGA